MQYTTSRIYEVSSCIVAYDDNLGLKSTMYTINGYAKHAQIKPTNSLPLKAVIYNAYHRGIDY